MVAGPAWAAAPVAGMFSPSTWNATVWTSLLRRDNSAPGGMTTGPTPGQGRRAGCRQPTPLRCSIKTPLWVAAGNLVQGVPLTEKDRSDLAEAERRIWLVSQEAR